MYGRRTCSFLQSKKAIQYSARMHKPSFTTVTRMRSSNSARMNQYNCTTEKIV